VRAAASVLGQHARERLVRFEVQSAMLRDEQFERTLATALAEILAAPIYVAFRESPASQWVEERPLGFGVDGFAVRKAAPAIAPRAALGRGVSLEFGAPTIAMKVGLHGVPARALRRMCDAVGSPRGGLLHIGATPAISIATGEPLMLIECSDTLKSPPARGVALLAIEAARYGGAVGEARLLSHVTLDVLLGALAENMQLPVEPAQIIDTRVAPP
jgi:hypothetical protein